MNDTKLLITLPKQMWKMLTKLAEEENTSKANLVRNAIHKYIEVAAKKRVLASPSEVAIMKSLKDIQEQLSALQQNKDNI